MRADSSLIVKHAELVGSSGIMEDRIFIGNKSVVVLDGATQADQTIEQTGGWMADQIGQRFSHYIETAGDEVELPELLAQAIADTRDEFNLVPGKSPSTTIATARFTANAIDLLVLGDSPALARGSHAPKVEVLQDRRLAQVSETLAKPTTVPDGGEDWQEYYRSLAVSRNHPQGFWIAEADPRAAAHARTQNIAHNSNVVLCTDGVSSVVDRYCLMGWRQLFESAQYPDGLVEKVHAIEVLDNQREKYPRSKISDDKLVSSICWGSV